MQTFSDLRGERQAAVDLPLFEAPAVARTFDTPEFRGITFYEVEAKSILNRVPASSRMPFEWTINVYRGCSHACAYCLAGDTPILMADGRTKPLADVEAGDAIYGTVREDHRRRYAITQVLAHWSTTKPAYRITLEDGTELVASGDHRFLTRHGWRYVTGSEYGQPHRPHLKENSELMGPGQFASSRQNGPEYRRGYLCGTIRGDRKQITAIRNQTRRGVVAIEEIIAWPHAPSAECGGLRERLRFHHTVDPAITRKRTIEGVAIGRDARRVVSIEPLGVDLPLYDITTGTGDFIANGIVSHNCFARPSHTYLNFDAGRDFETKVVVKVNAPEVLRRELRRPSWSRAPVAMGTNTDPYQRCEGRYRLTRGVLEALRDHRNPCSVLTKSSLLVRDLDLFEELAATAGFTASLSIGTLDEEVWRRSEPGTPHPRARMAAVRTLRRAGIACGILMAPILPGMSDAPEQLRAVVRAAAEAGATHLSPLTLHLRPGVKEEFMPWLAREYPELVEGYRRLYRGSNAPKATREAIADQVRAEKGRYPVTPAPVIDPPAARQVHRDSGAAAPAAPGTQLSLTLD
jgi:DNA repair photolyase